METFDIQEQTITEIQKQFQTGRLTAEQLVTHYLTRIAEHDQHGATLNAIAIVNPKALDEAKALDRAYQKGEIKGPFHGIPVLVKDNYETKGLQTAAGSVALKGWEPTEDAFIVKKLREAGAIILAKTNMHELARGITTVGSLFGATRNPYKLDRNPGGSSGGTGAAVAANFGVVGWGTDTCGSITIPAAHNNLFGIRVTQGLASQSGIVPLARTQDVGGPLARTVTDLALALDVTVGSDPNDPQTAEADQHIPKSYAENLNASSLQGARIGILTDLLAHEDDDQPVADMIRQAAVVMRDQGAIISDVSIPDLYNLLNDKLEGFLIINYEVRECLDQFFGNRPSAPVRSFDDILAHKEVWEAMKPANRRFEMLKTLEPGDYEKHLQKRAILKKAIYETMAKADVDTLIYPTIRRTAMPIGQRQIGGSNAKLSSNSGLPVISVPVGFAADGLPVGMNILGRVWDESRLLNLAYAFEQATNYRRPPASTITQ